MFKSSHDTSKADSLIFKCESTKKEQFKNMLEKLKTINEKFKIEKYEISTHSFKDENIAT